MHKLFAAAMFFALPVSVMAQGANALYSADGVEVRADERVFLLFGLFNALGYDQESLRGPAPLKVPRYSPLRAEVRRSLFAKKLDLSGAEKMLQEHPDSLDIYVIRALGLSAPPALQPAPEADAATQALALALQSFYAELGKELLNEQSLALHQEAGVWLKHVDLQTALIREKLRFADDEALMDVDDDPALEDEAPRWVVIANPLESHGVIRSLSLPEMNVLVVGPCADPNTAPHQALVQAMMGLTLRPTMVRALARFKPEKLRKALIDRGVAKKAVATPVVPILEAIAPALVSVVYGSRMGLKPAAVLAKAADKSAQWLAGQTGHFQDLAVGLLEQLLGIKPRPMPKAVAPAKVAPKIEAAAPVAEDKVAKDKIKKLANEADKKPVPAASQEARPKAQKDL